MKTYIVTGGAGFVGSHLADRLLSEGNRVLAMDNLVTGSESNISHLKREPRLEFIPCDVSEKIPEVGKVDGVYHLASPASPVDFVHLAIPIMKVGSLGTLHGLDYAKKHNAWFFMASTSEVYGDPQVHPQHESYFGNVNPIGIRGVYDEAKRFSEGLVMAYHRTHKLETSIVRIFNTYGPRMRPDDGRVISNFICQALQGLPLTVHGKGLQTRSFCYVDDLVEGIFRFSIKKPVLPVNLGNDRENTVLEIANTVIALVASKSQIQFHDLPEGDPKRRRPDISRAKETLDWAPLISLEDGLKKTIDYFRTRL